MKTDIVKVQFTIEIPLEHESRLTPGGRSKLVNEASEASVQLTRIKLREDWDFQIQAVEFTNGVRVSWNIRSAT